MSIEEAIGVLEADKNFLYPDECHNSKAYDMAIEALKKAYSLEHVIVKRPKYGDFENDGCIDRQRMLLFYDPIPCEFARRIGISWRADNEN